MYPIVPIGADHRSSPLPEPPHRLLDQDGLVSDGFVPLNLQMHVMVVLVHNSTINTQPHMQTQAPSPALSHRSVAQGVFQQPQQLGAKQGGLLILNLRKDQSKTRRLWHQTNSRRYLERLKLNGIRTEQTLPALVLMSAFPMI